jgi:hypothetical protein
MSTVQRWNDDQQGKLKQSQADLLYQEVDGRIILRWIFRKWEGVVDGVCSG